MVSTVLDGGADGSTISKDEMKSILGLWVLLPLSRACTSSKIFLHEQ
jgi:hypothetical protein